MWDVLLKSLYFFLPASLANISPVLARFLPMGATPISEKYFGSNKTWKGIIAATLTGGLVFWIQKALYLNGFTELAIIDYADFSIAVGFLLGFGAIFGDLVKSYYKRKAKIKPGKSWLPWDQLDFVLGGLLFSFLVYVPPVEVAVTIVVVSPFLHVLINYIGYLLKVNKEMF
ncbi:MAG: CDP-archaeol synthase [Nanoarchaeota archaeon]|nr:CDP-archaeol synthase [Nanoarchaeota archaeon]